MFIVQILTEVVAIASRIQWYHDMGYSSDNDDGNWTVDTRRNHGYNSIINKIFPGIWYDIIP